MSDYLISEEDFDAANHGISWDVWQAYVSLVGDNYATIEDAEESYAGAFDNDEEFAEEFLSDVYDLSVIPDLVKNNIDWSGVAHELMFDYIVEDGHYFRNL